MILNKCFGHQSLSSWFLRKEKIHAQGGIQTRDLLIKSRMLNLLSTHYGPQELKIKIYQNVFVVELYRFHWNLNQTHASVKSQMNFLKLEPGKKLNLKLKCNRSFEISIHKLRRSWKVRDVCILLRRKTLKLALSKCFRTGTLKVNQVTKWINYWCLFCIGWIV